MRRSGSSSCMLRPKADAMDEKMSVTLINTQTLPTYSSERFYMLSELELHAHSTTFLCDAADCDQTQDTAESSEASLDYGVQQPQQQHQQQPLTSSYNILYILWRPDQASSPRAFAEGTMAAAIQQWKTMDGSSTTHTTTASTEEDVSPRTKSTQEPAMHLYLVVDIATLPEGTTDMDKNARQRQFQVQVDTAERLARHVAQSKDFRLLVDGITVGISSHVRAAPGLEAIVDAVSLGSTLRRRHSSSSSDQNSNIGLVALNPDDLLGLQDETVTDAAQGVLQSRTCAEWNGNGNLLTYAKRAHSAWCKAHDVDEEDLKTLQSKLPKYRKRRHRGRLGDDDLDFDPLMTCLVIFFFGYVLSHVWVTYYAER